MVVSNESWYLRRYAVPLLIFPGEVYPTPPCAGYFHYKLSM